MASAIRSWSTLRLLDPSLAVARDTGMSWRINSATISLASRSLSFE
jgi:hypothetical protein